MASGIPITVKNPAGKHFSVTVASTDITFSELTDTIVQTYFPGQAKRIVYVVAGKTVSSEDRLSDHQIPEKTVYAIIKDPVPASERAPSQESTPERAPSQESTPEQQLGLHEYTGEQIKRAVQRDSGLYIYLIHMLARVDPFILSYIGLNPEMAQSVINNILDNPTFVLKVSFGAGVADPFLDESGAAAVTEETQNPYLVDKQNIEYIMRAVKLSVTEENYYRIKDLYLFLDRDITNTIQYLK